MMPNRISSRRGNDQFTTLFGETGTWTVHGSGGRVLAMAANLGHAIEKAVEFATADRKVIAIARQPSEDIIVFTGQSQRLANVLATSLVTGRA